MIALDPRGSYQWVHPFDRELSDELRTTFEIKVLTIPEREAVTKWTLEAERNQQLVTKLSYDILRIALLNVVNFQAPDGTMVEPVFVPRPSTMTVTQRPTIIGDETLQLIPPVYIEGLVMEVASGASANEADRKK